MPRRAVRCGLAGPGFDVAAHVLAHVPVSAGAPPLVRAASLHDARYVAWCAGALGEAASGAARRDGPLLGALLERASAGHLLQALVGLHADPETHRTGAVRELDALGAAAVPWAVDALGALADDHPELVAIARCAVGLVARGYATAWETHIRPELEAVRVAVEEHLAVIAASVPSCATTPVALSHPLGARGRVLPDLVVVGAPVGWAAIDAARAAAIAVHELAVAAAGEVVAAGARLDAGASPEQRWAHGEALALAAVPRLLPPGPVAEAHRQHVASLDLGALGPADPGAVERLVARLGA